MGSARARWAMADKTRLLISVACGPIQCKYGTKPPGFLQFLGRDSYRWWKKSCIQAPPAWEKASVYVNILYIYIFIIGKQQMI